MKISKIMRVQSKILYVENGLIYDSFALEAEVFQTNNTQIEYIQKIVKDQEIAITNYPILK